LIDRKERKLIVVSDDLKRLVYYTFEGEVVYENELTNFPDGMKYFIDHRGNIIFFDDIKNTIYK
jgi:hypothetical protein